MGRYSWIIILIIFGVNMILRMIAKRAEAAAKEKASQARIDATLSGPRAPASNRPAPPVVMSREGMPLEVPRPTPRPPEVLRSVPPSVPKAPAPSIPAPRRDAPPIPRRAPVPQPVARPATMRSPASPMARSVPAAPPPVSAKRQGGVMRPLPTPAAPKPVRAVSPSAPQGAASTDRLKRKLSHAYGNRTIDQPLLHSKPTKSTQATQRTGLVSSRAVAEAMNSPSELRLAFVLAEVLGRPASERPMISRNLA